MWPRTWRSERSGRRRDYATIGRGCRLRERRKIRCNTNVITSLCATSHAVGASRGFIGRICPSVTHTSRTITSTAPTTIGQTTRSVAPSATCRSTPWGVAASITPRAANGVTSAPTTTDTDTISVAPSSTSRSIAATSAHCIAFSLCTGSVTSTLTGRSVSPGVRVAARGIGTRVRPTAWGIAPIGHGIGPTARCKGRTSRSKRLGGTSERIRWRPPIFLVQTLSSVRRCL